MCKVFLYIIFDILCQSLHFGARKKFHNVLYFEGIVSVSKLDLVGAFGLGVNILEYFLNNI